MESLCTPNNFTFGGIYLHFACQKSEKSDRTESFEVSELGRFLGAFSIIWRTTGAETGIGFPISAVFWQIAVFGTQPANGRPIKGATRIRSPVWLAKTETNL